MFLKQRTHYSRSIKRKRQCNSNFLWNWMKLHGHINAFLTSWIPVSRHQTQNAASIHSYFTLLEGDTLSICGCYLIRIERCRYKLRQGVMTNLKKSVLYTYIFWCVARKQERGSYGQQCYRCADYDELQHLPLRPLQPLGDKSSRQQASA